MVEALPRHHKHAFFSALAPGTHVVKHHGEYRWTEGRRGRRGSEGGHWKPPLPLNGKPRVLLKQAYHVLGHADCRGGAFTKVPAMQSAVVVFSKYLEVQGYDVYSQSKPHQACGSLFILHTQPKTPSSHLPPRVPYCRPQASNAASFQNPHRLTCCYFPPERIAECTSRNE